MPVAEAHAACARLGLPESVCAASAAGDRPDQMPCAAEVQGHITRGANPIETLV